MGEPIKQRSGHLGIAEDRRPFAEAQIGGDDDTGAFVELAHQVEEERSTRGAEQQIPQLVKDHEIELGQTLGDLPRLALRLFLFERVDEFDGREEPDLSAMMLDGLNAERGGDMGFTGPRSAPRP